ncbi:MULTISPECIES: YfiR/HmsC family protein [Gammaproteobacteria]|uniref:YfiR/HmsC family protein n=1 Tax=Gammaproteobacteria TaxID=1236 RepID=UPI000DCF7460|nr:MULTISPECIES: YfiR/HmsC family protein [Gammaproteobacteria]RTE87612.1 DUF4154 domain-containing protein [Aliidiomarina sp. B3213]TCZ92603.1 DUF4154 domain-containing protein [Lysobacter sp. N42]
MIKSCKKLLASLLLTLLLFSSLGNAQQAIEDVSESELYASYFSTVVKFIAWPDENQKDTLQLGIIEAPEVLEELNRVQLEPVRGLPLRLREVLRTTQLNDIDALLVGPRAQGQLSQIESLARSRNILVITIQGDIRGNTMINLASNENLELSYQVNSQLIEQAGLRIQNGLFDITGDELELLVELRRQKSQEQTLTEQVEAYELEIENMQERERQLNERIEMLEQAIRERDDILSAQAGTLEEREIAVANLRDRLTQYLTELDEQRERILVREEQLATIQQQLRQSQQRLDEQEQELIEKEQLLQERQDESAVLSERIASNRDILADQEQRLLAQNAEIEEQLQLIENREQTISRQQDFLLYIGIGLLFAFVFAVLSIVMYVNKRKTADELMKTLNELSAAQDKLVESEKMAALGNLVAGVAHEVNTPLGVALTATTMLNDRRERLIETISTQQLTREQLDAFLSKAEESLSLTEKNLSRVARLISNFKQVAVDQMVSERREIDLREYLEEIMSTLSIELRRAQIKYEILVDSKITMTTIPGAMAQIITNLTTNSIRHGFEGSTGTITLAAEPAPGDNIKITFKDNGSGMEPQVVQQVFEPFFTTKRNEGGTGLGMPIVYNLVRQKLNGDIKVESKPDEGTTFTLILPRVSPVRA